MTTPKKKKTNYLNNRDLLAEVIKSKENGQMTDKLARMLMMLCKRYASRGNFANYSYNEDMQGYALQQLCNTWNNFDPAKSSNPFAFFTQCVKNSFIQYLNQEKRERKRKDSLLIEYGFNPSYTYQVEHEMSQQGDDYEPADPVESNYDHLNLDTKIGE